MKKQVIFMNTNQFMCISRKLLSAYMLVRDRSHSMSVISCLYLTMGTLASRMRRTSVQPGRNHWARSASPSMCR